MIIVFIRENQVMAGNFDDDEYSRELFPVFAKYLSPLTETQREKISNAINELKLALIRENKDGRFAI